MCVCRGGNCLWIHYIARVANTPAFVISDCSLSSWLSGAAWILHYSCATELLCCSTKAFWNRQVSVLGQEIIYGLVWELVLPYLLQHTFNGHASEADLGYLKISFIWYSINDLESTECCSDSISVDSSAFTMKRGSQSLMRFLGAKKWRHQQSHTIVAPSLDRILTCSHKSMYNFLDHRIQGLTRIYHI